MRTTREHGGAIDRARARFGGERSDWLDLSTGINPRPWPWPEPIPAPTAHAWAGLPDEGDFERLKAAARRFWQVPQETEILPAPGASALIAILPSLLSPARVAIEPDTYNEHAAAFRHWGWEIVAPGAPAEARVLVHPDNPTGHLARVTDVEASPFTIIDESFCDTLPAQSLVRLVVRPGVIVLKSFGKFWGLAGLRLGFAIGHHDTLAPLAERLGPWAVSGPALEIGAAALQDDDWAEQTRARLAADAARLDALLQAAGARILGGTNLFRLVEVDRAARWQDGLGRYRILARTFEKHPTRMRFGLPGNEDGWKRLETALKELAHGA